MTGLRVESGIGMLRLEGSLVAENAGKLRATLMESLRSTDHVVFDLKNVVDIDLAGFHLLCSMHRIAAMLNKSLTLNGKSPEVFKRVVEEAGYSRHRGCIWDRNRRCLFLNGRAEKGSN